MSLSEFVKRHSRESGNLCLYAVQNWIPACARMTLVLLLVVEPGLFAVRCVFADEVSPNASAAETSIFDISPLLPLTGKSAPILPEEGWIRDQQPSQNYFKDKVGILLTFECSDFHFVRMLPYLKDWQEKYHDDGFGIIGIHGADYAVDADTENVKQALEHWHIDWPMAMTTEAWMVTPSLSLTGPRSLIIGSDGSVLFEHAGEGEYRSMETIIAQALGQLRPDFKAKPLSPFRRDEDQPGIIGYPVTPLLRLGYASGKLPSPIIFENNKTVNYNYRFAPINDHRIYVSGHWRSDAQALNFQGDHFHVDDHIQLAYRAAEVYVMASGVTDHDARVYLEMDGKALDKRVAGADVIYDRDEHSFILVNRPRVYQIINEKAVTSRRLFLHPSEKNICFYYFGFGSRRVK